MAGDRPSRRRILLSDKLVNKNDLDSPDLLAMDAKVVEKGIGLIPAEFEDFWFDKRSKAA